MLLNKVFFFKTTLNLSCLFLFLHLLLCEAQVFDLNPNTNGLKPEVNNPEETPIFHLEGFVQNNSNLQRDNNEDLVIKSPDSKPKEGVYLKNEGKETILERNVDYAGFRPNQELKAADSKITEGNSFEFSNRDSIEVKKDELVQKYLLSQEKREKENKAIVCPDNCQNCKSEDSCETCYPSFTLLNNQCIEPSLKGSRKLFSGFNFDTTSLNEQSDSKLFFV